MTEEKVNDDGTVEVTVEVAGDGGNTVLEFIAYLQRGLEAIPEEYRQTASLDLAAYDWEGIFIGYTRPMTDEERAAIQATLLEGQELVASSTPDEIEAWIRGVRFRIDSDRDSATALVMSGKAPKELHQRYLKASKMGID